MSEKEFTVPAYAKREFPKATFVNVLAPYNRNDVVGLSEDIQDGKLIVIGVSDLCRFSKNSTPGFLSYPQQLSKIQREAALLRALTGRSTSARATKAAINEEKRICSNPEVVHGISKIANHLGFSGDVIEYVDSHGMSKNGVDRYTISTKPLSNLTSYIGIAFKKKTRNGSMSQLEINIALGTMRSMLARNVARKRYKLALPSFHRFHDLKTGVFVRTGVQRGNKFIPNCSRGFMEDSKTTTADGFLHAVESCDCDNKKRWRSPIETYRVDEHLLRFELLEPRKNWRCIPGHRAQSAIRLDGKNGMRLVMDTGKSAMFLPHESRNYWNKTSLMRTLVKQAGATLEDLPYAVAEVFRSITFGG